MIKKLMLAGVILTLFLGLGLIGPGLSEAQFCQDEVACSTVTSMNAFNDLVLCQYFRSSSELSRGQVDYIYCRKPDNKSDNEPKAWTCRRRVPRGLPSVTLTESEWNNEVVRCSKLCGECSGGWKRTSAP
jgi:hypothetical protein